MRCARDRAHARDRARTRSRTHAIAHARDRARDQAAETIDIAITLEPDFRSALLNETLTVHSSIGVLEFPIIGTMP